MMKRYIILEMLDHIDPDEAQEFADEINAAFRPHYDARVVVVEEIDPQD